MKKALALLIVFACFILAAAPVQAFEEYIPEFASRIRVNSDGTITVTENIYVRVTGQKFKHGIIRRIPTTYQDGFGNTLKGEIIIARVEKDGSDEPSFMNDTPDGVELYIGRKDVSLWPGDYTYTIEYILDRQIEPGANFDSLTREITGYYWSVPIRKARVAIELPPGARVSDKRARTGAPGVNGSDFAVSGDQWGNLVFETTDVLEPGEGLSIYAAWPRGYVRYPSREQAGPASESEEPAPETPEEQREKDDVDRILDVIESMEQILGN